MDERTMTTHTHHTPEQGRTGRSLYEQACALAKQGFLLSARAYLYAAEKQGRVTPAQIRDFHDIVTAYRDEQKRRGV
jgi:hypothetical protein